MNQVECPKCGGAASRMYARRKGSGKTKWTITDYVFCHREGKPVVLNVREAELCGREEVIVAKTQEDKRAAPSKFQQQESKGKWRPPKPADPNKPIVGLQAVARYNLDRKEESE